MPSRPSPTLGTVLREIRSKRGWSLAQMSGRIDIPVSTLSKIEHDRLTLTYERLRRVGQRLEIPASRLFGESRGRQHVPKAGLRSIARADFLASRRVFGRDEVSLCAELREKCMSPTMVRLRAGEDAGGVPAMVRGEPGEKFVYVIEGEADVHNEFYAPLTLKKGEGLYFDASMQHGLAAAAGCAEALLLVMAAT